MALRKRISPKEIEEVLTKPQVEKETPVNMDNVISTGSTLLDLAISGRRRRGGGVPGGLLIEIAGLPMGGKTTILGEMCADVQTKGGIATIGDAERRMDPSFIKMMGLKINEDNLSKPRLISDAKDLILNAPQSENGEINLVAIDSVAVLMSTMEDEKEDKRGVARAKELHQLCRKAKDVIADPNRIVLFTNQVQDVQDPMPGQARTKTAGGYAIPFLASLRISVTQIKKVEKSVKMGTHEIKRAIGVHSIAKVIKSSIDAPYREADIYILFDYGIDDIRANLQYIKDNSGEKTFWTVDSNHISLEKAISHIEQNNLKHELKEATITMWEEIDKNFQLDRLPKERG